MPGQLTQTTATPTVRATARTERRCVASQDLSHHPDQIAEALRIVAILLEDNHIYLPIFERLEDELKAAIRKTEALARARAIAQKATSS